MSWCAQRPYPRQSTLFFPEPCVHMGSAFGKQQPLPVLQKVHKGVALGSTQSFAAVRRYLSLREVCTGVLPLEDGNLLLHRKEFTEVVSLAT